MAHTLKIKLPGVENDPTACYNCILMNMMGTVFQRMGFPEGPLLQLQEEVLLNVIHYLKNTFGITVDSYTSRTPAMLLFGSTELAKEVKSWTSFMGVH
jgi:hypothetical protein